MFVWGAIPDKFIKFPTKWKMKKSKTKSKKKKC